MAFQKTITQQDAGISSTYWRITGIFIDVPAAQARIEMAGYTSAELRMAGGRSVDLRAYDLTPAQFAEIAKVIYAPLATELYRHIGKAPRGIPLGAVFDADTGNLLIPQTGEVIPAELVTLNEHSMPIWLPSEFADAIAV